MPSPMMMMMTKAFVLLLSLVSSSVLCASDDCADVVVRHGRVAPVGHGRGRVECDRGYSIAAGPDRGLVRGLARPCSKLATEEADLCVRHHPPAAKTPRERMLNDEPNYEETYDSKEDYEAAPDDNYDPEGDYEKADYDYTREGGNGNGEEEEKQLAKEHEQVVEEGKGEKSKKANAEQYGDYYDYDYNGEGKKKNSVENDGGRQHLHETQAGNDIKEEEEADEVPEEEEENPHEEQHEGEEFTDHKEESPGQEADEKQHENENEEGERAKEESLPEDDTEEIYEGEDADLQHNNKAIGEPTQNSEKSSQPAEERNSDEEEKQNEDEYDDSEGGEEDEYAEEPDHEGNNHSESTHPKEEEEALDIDEEYGRVDSSAVSSSTRPPPPSPPPRTTPPSSATTSDDEDLGEGSGAEDPEAKDPVAKNPVAKDPEREEISTEKQHAIRLAFYDVHEIDILRLDTTCVTDFKQAPKIQHAVVRTYNERVPNEAVPGDFYAEVLFECENGFALAAESPKSLYCSESEWIGREPECERVAGSQDAGRPADRPTCGDSLFRTKGCQQLCFEEAGGATCACHDGYTLAADGKTCNDVDECAADNGGCAFACLNKPGTFECSCATGFEARGLDCIDINECLLNNGHGPCQDTCSNTDGGYVCSCHGLTGTILAADNHTCQTWNGCEVNNGNCSHQCLESYNKVFCLCPEGFVLSPDWRTCQDVDECLLQVRLNCSQQCVNTPGSAHCDCHPGFTLDEDMRTCVDVDECAEESPCGLHGACVNTHGSFACACHQGFELAPDSQSCQDVDECAEEQEDDEAGNEDGPCGLFGECVNTVGAFECQCDHGYNFANGTCVDINECLMGNPCINGDCINTEPGYECSCFPGFEFAGGFCKDIDECAQQGDRCGKYGDCVNLEGGYKCTCKPGFEARDGVCVDVDECANVTRHACHHTCVNTPGSFECVCRDGFVVDPEDESKCVDHDECASGTAVCQQLCVNEHGGYGCGCVAGYAPSAADPTQCEDIDECSGTSPCQQLCTNNMGSFTCSCREGYSISPHDATRCVDVDECAVANGGCSHDCLNVDGSHFCACPPDMRLRLDQRTCKAVPQEPLPCKSPRKPSSGFMRCTKRKRNGHYPVGTRCKLKCHRGFVANGPMKKECLADSTWSGGEATCEAVSCPALPHVPNGRIEPEGCQLRPSPTGVKCKFRCDSGFALSGALKSTRCSPHGRWKGLEDNNNMPTCQMEALKPFIICPPDISKSLPGRSTTAYVMLSQPKTNVDWFRYVDSEPAWAKHLEGELSRGKHVVTFRARSPGSADATASCSLTVHISDAEPPKVVYCPDSFTEFLSPGQSRRRVSWREPVFQDNVAVVHVSATFTPTHYFAEGRHHVLYQAVDSDANKAKCAFTVTIRGSPSYGLGLMAPPSPAPTTTSAPPTMLASPLGSAADAGSGRLGPRVPERCDDVPQVANGHMACIMSYVGKKCTPVCQPGHQFYQQFTSRPPTYICNEHRVDWVIRRFIPDCSPVFSTGSESTCPVGWEARGAGLCVACPPGMFRHESDRLCQLCPKDSFAARFSMDRCQACADGHTTAGLGSRSADDCHFHRPVAASWWHARRDQHAQQQQQQQQHQSGLTHYNRWSSSQAQQSAALRRGW